MPIKKPKTKALAIPRKPVKYDPKNNLMNKKEIIEPKGDLAVTHPNSDVVKERAASENKKELLLKYFKNLGNLPSDIAPIILKPDGKGGIDIIETKVDKKGKIIIPKKMRGMSDKEIKEREKYAAKIATAVKDVVHRDMERVTFTAMCRKPLPTLKKVWKKLNNKTHKPEVRLQNRLGCIFLEIDEVTLEI